MDGATEWSKPNLDMAFPIFILLASRLFTPKHTRFCTIILIVNNPKLKNVIRYFLFGPKCGP
jgi:hypothetical protein